MCSCFAIILHQNFKVGHRHFLFMINGIWPSQWALLRVANRFSPDRNSDISSPTKVQLFRTSILEAHPYGVILSQKFTLKTVHFFCSVHVLLFIVKGIRHIDRYCVNTESQLIAKTPWSVE